MMVVFKGQIYSLKNNFDDEVEQACRALHANGEVIISDNFDPLEVARHLKWEPSGTVPTDEAIAQAMYELDMLKEAHHD